MYKDWTSCDCGRKFKRRCPEKHIGMVQCVCGNCIPVQMPKFHEPSPHHCCPKPAKHHRECYRDGWMNN